MCVEILLNSVILFISKFTDPVITAKCAYDEIFLNKETHFPEREVKKKYLLFCYTNSFLSIIKL